MKFPTQMDLIQNIEAEAAGELVKITGGVQPTQYELITTFRRIQDKARKALRAMSCRSLPDVAPQGSGQASTSFPRPASSSQLPDAPPGTLRVAFN